MLNVFIVIVIDCCLTLVSCAFQPVVALINFLLTYLLIYLRIGSSCLVSTLLAYRLDVCLSVCQCWINFFLEVFELQNNYFSKKYLKYFLELLFSICGTKYKIQNTFPKSN